jgi:N4-(beta-N-acetylglucosaminyl)-L-asparaginase
LLIHTWPWPDACAAGYALLSAGAPPLDAVQAAAETCEVRGCDGTVGAGGSPDEGGGTTLDAVIIDGPTRRAGGVGCLARVPAAVAAARLVMETTTHTLLVGPGADAFAMSMGLPARKNLSSPSSTAAWRSWRAGGCQPNFRAPGAVAPDPRRSCGPYELVVGGGGEAAARARARATPPPITALSHDTIAAVAVSASRAVAAAASSNGAGHKVPGRVGDAAVAGGGAAATPAGGCGSTGDGDAHLRFLPCAHALALLEGGASPREAAEAAVARVARAEPRYVGALIVAAADGSVGAAAHGWTFRYTHASPATGGVPVIVTVAPMEAVAAAGSA